MAKSTFERNKPHLNFLPSSAASSGADSLPNALARVGVSNIGANQFAQGQIVTNPTDRQRLVEIMYAAVGVHDISGALVKIN